MHDLVVRGGCVVTPFGSTDADVAVSDGRIVEVAPGSAGGREEGRDPYYAHLYRIGLDGRGLELLTLLERDARIGDLSRRQEVASLAEQHFRLCTGGLGERSGRPHRDDDKDGSSYHGLPLASDRQAILVELHGRRLDRRAGPRWRVGRPLRAARGDRSVR